MPRDTQISKKESSKRNKREDKMLRRKKVESSDSDSDNNSNNDSENEEMDIHECRKIISSIFPSKHMDKKVKAGERLKKLIESESEEDESEEWETESEEEISVKKLKKKNAAINKKKKNKHYEQEEDDYDSEDDSDYVEEEEEESEEYVEEDDDSDEESEEEESEEEKPQKKGKKINIIFTIGAGKKCDHDCESDCDLGSELDGYEDSDDITEDEDEEVSTDESDKEEEEQEKEKEVKNKKSNKKKSEEGKKEETKEEPSDALNKLHELLKANPKDKSIKKCIEMYEKDVKMQKAKEQKKHKKTKDKNLRIFKKILNDKNTMNDFSFYEKLDAPHQTKIIKELREINKITRIDKPYRMTLLESDIPVQFKSTAMKKINSIRYMEPGSGEFYKNKNWVDTFMRIPFNKYEGLPVSINDGVEKCHEFMENAQKTLDQAVYGLNDAKMQIMQMIGQLLTNPKSIGAAIAIHGPPGTGKTSLVKDGISKILNRPFAFLALGGATDSSFLEGHGYTYEGSTWGKIVQILIDSKCMNPVIYFDELDKISETPRGEEIAGILTHLTDTTQNSQFHDKYFAEVDFDLSKCLFIFSYNDETKVNPILKDRMYRIRTKGYIPKEKTIIANNYLLPKIREQVRFKDEEITIPNDVINYIIDTHCNKEDGVRNLKRCLEIIHTKLNLYRLMKPGSNLFEGEMSLKVEFPYNVTKDIVDKLIKKDTENVSALWGMYV